MKLKILKFSLISLIILLPTMVILAQNNQEQNENKSEEQQNNTEEEEEKAEEENIGAQTITIVGGFEPSLQDANKIISNPKADDTVFIPPVFDYQFEDVKLFTPFNITPIKPAIMRGEPLDKLYANYLSLGMGTKATPYFEYAHSKLRSRDLKYNFRMKHISAAADIDNYAYPGISRNEAGLDLTKYFKTNALQFHASYNRNSLHYYGYLTELDSLAIVKEADNKQIFNIVNSGFRFYKYKPKRNKSEFDIKLNYTLLNDISNYNENKISLDADYKIPIELIGVLDDEKLEFNIKSSFYNRKLDTLLSQNQFDININPEYKFSYGFFKADVGIILGIKSDTIAEAKIFPNINVQLAAIENILYFDMLIDGGYKNNNYLSFSNENPFITAFNDFEYSEKTVGLKFGIKSSISSKLNLNINIEYAEWKNGAFFISDTNDLIIRKFKTVYDDYNLVNINTSISYLLKQKLKLILEADYYVYSMDRLLAAYHKPEFEINFTGIYNIQNKFVVNAKIKALGKSSNLIHENGIAKKVDIDEWIDASIGLEYKYSQRLSFFANFNNLANMKYQRFYNYPTYGFNVMGGVSYIF